MYPAPELLAFPTFLGGESPLVLACRRETAIAEKFHAMAVLGRANTRLRDFLDVWGLAQGFAFAGAILAGAMGKAFERRRTELPAVGDGLSEFLLPPVEGLRSSGGYHGEWLPGGPWMSEARGGAG